MLLASFWGFAKYLTTYFLCSTTNCVLQKDTLCEITQKFLCCSRYIFAIMNSQGFILLLVFSLSMKIIYSRITTGIIVFGLQLIPSHNITNIPGMASIDHFDLVYSKKYELFPQLKTRQ